MKVGVINKSLLREGKAKTYEEATFAKKLKDNKQREHQPYFTNFKYRRT
jgi:hypothetical protein